MGKLNQKTWWRIAALAAIALGAGWGLLRWRDRVPDRVYRIGADQAPPYNYLRAGGPPEGLAVSTLTEAARRAGIRLEWVPVHTLPDEAFRRGLVDLWPALAPTPWRLQNFHMTDSWMSNNFVLVSLAEREVRNGGKVIAMRGGAILSILAGKYLPHAEHRILTSREASVQAVCRGEADSALVEARFMDSALAERPEGCSEARLKIDAVPGMTSDLRIMARKESAAAANALYRAILGMAADGTLTGILEHWTPFSSVDARSVYALREAEQHNLWFQWGLLALVLATAALGWQTLRAQSAQGLAREAQAAAEAANAAKSEFLANMSHEIRTPLSGIIGMARLLREGPITEDKRGEVETLGRAGESLLTIINDILDIAKVEAGELRLVREAFDLRRCVQLGVDLMRPRAQEKGLTLQCDYAEAAPRWIWGDEVRVRQIVLNLLGNALKFTDNGSVHLAVRPIEAGLIRIEVTDTGIGIAEDKRERLFHKFSQADASMSRRYGGTGLGLAISKELAKRMGGRIGYESRVGEGSTFWLELLAAEAPEPVVQPAPAAAPVTELARGRILVVEDNAINQRVLLRSLEKLGVEVDIAANGKEGVDRWKSAVYDLVLMDCQMPGMDGYEATALIRAAERDGRHTPIVALTAHAMPEDRARCEAAGMDDYLTKPVDIAALRAVLGRFTGGDGRPGGRPHET